MPFDDAPFGLSLYAFNPSQKAGTETEGRQALWLLSMAFTDDIVGLFSGLFCTHSSPIRMHFSTWSTWEGWPLRDGSINSTTFPLVQCSHTCTRLVNCSVIMIGIQPRTGLTSFGSSTYKIYEINILLGVAGAVVSSSRDDLQNQNTEAECIRLCWVLTMHGIFRRHVSAARRR